MQILVGTAGDFLLLSIPTLSVFFIYEVFMARISVIMPVYNGEKYLKEAIDSILHQTFDDFELIVINDCSSDSTEEIIQSYDDCRIRYIKNEKNSGVAATLNRGLDIAEGEYIARMDADDISLPQRFEKQAEFLDQNPDVAVCGAEVELFGDVENSDTYTVFGKDETKINLLFSSCLCHPAVMMRSSVMKNYRYDKTYDKFEDYEMWTRVMLKHNIDNVHGVLFKYRIHKSQVTQNYTEELMERYRAIKENMLKNLGVTYKKDEFDAFYSFSRGIIDYNLNLLSLAQMFENIILSNNNTNFFNHKKLANCFKSILINGFEKQNTITLSQLNKITKLVKYTDIIKVKSKTLIKRILRGNA